MLCVIGKLHVTQYMNFYSFTCETCARDLKQSAQLTNEMFLFERRKSFWSSFMHLFPFGSLLISWWTAWPRSPATTNAVITKKKSKHIH